MVTQATPSIADRLLLILKSEGGRASDRSVYEKSKREQLVTKGYWQHLEESTGIKASAWSNFVSGKQKPTTEMIEAIARAMPYYAFWLASGITDVLNGHIAPVAAATFPEFSHEYDKDTSEYFHRSMILQHELYKRIDSPADLERITSTGDWEWRMSTKMVEVAYSLAESEDYSELRRLHAKRLKERDHRKALLEGTNRPWLDQDNSNEIPPIYQPITDVRVAHQDKWDLFYKPASDK